MLNILQTEIILLNHDQNVLFVHKIKSYSHTIFSSQAMVDNVTSTKSVIRNKLTLISVSQMSRCLPSVQMEPIGEVR